MPEDPGTLDFGAGKPWDTNFGAGKTLGHNFGAGKTLGHQVGAHRESKPYPPIPTQPSMHSTTRLPGYAQDCSSGNLGISGSKMHPRSAQIRIFCMMGWILGYMVSVSERFAQVCSIILHLFCRG